MENLVKIMEDSKNLSEGQVMLVTARKVEGGKYSVEFAQNIMLEGTSLAGLFNASDERFKGTSSVLRTWQSVELDDFCKLLNIDKSKYFAEENLQEFVREGGEVINVYPLGIVNPTISGSPVTLRIVERLGLKGEWENSNPERAIKKNPNQTNGGFLYKNDQPIVRDFQIVKGNYSSVSHVLIQHDEVRQSIFSKEISVASEQ